MKISSCIILGLIFSHTTYALADGAPSVTVGDSAVYTGVQNGQTATITQTVTSVSGTQFTISYSDGTTTETETDDLSDLNPLYTLAANCAQSGGQAATDVLSSGQTVNVCHFDSVTIYAGNPPVTNVDLSLDVPFYIVKGTTDTQVTLVSFIKK